jgi:putative serine protease PepD
MATNRFDAQRNLRVLVTLVVLVVLTSCTGPQPPETTPSPPTTVPTTEPIPADPTSIISQLQSTTVQIFARVRTGGTLQTAWSGSGTIISADGLILTNAHVASPWAPGVAALYGNPDLVLGPEPDSLVVALTEREDQPPVETYIAELVAVDGPLDLAVIRVTQTVDGSPLDPADLDLPFVDLGDSDDVHLGDTILVFGFPGAGGDTLTFTRGVVSGFESQDGIGTRAWIKTDTTFSPGNSGGLAADGQGLLIGVPSGVTEAAGGAINSLRPVNLAQPVIAAAQAGRTYESPYVVPGSGNEALTLQTWAEDFGEDGCAVNPLTSYPSGAAALVAVFDYQGMTDGEDFMLTFFYGEQLVRAEVWPWHEGNSGSCRPFFHHAYGDPLPDGTYEVVLFTGADLHSAGGGSTQIGEQIAADGVQVGGYVFDADSGKGIPGALVFVLNPGVDLDAWLDDLSTDAIYTSAETDDDGFYLLPILLERGVSYPAAAGAAGYFDNYGSISLSADTPNEFRIDIELTK